MNIDLNCDMGEGFATDRLLMPCISSANIACGAHAGNVATMQQTIELALQHQVAIGAHPGYADRENFGRIYIPLEGEALFHLVAGQIFQLRQLVQSAGGRLRHVKPHGALYNHAAKDQATALTIARAVKEVDATLVLFGLSNSCSLRCAQQEGLAVAAEAFADRSYQADGSLTPRSNRNALLENKEAVLQQVLQIVISQQVLSIDKQKVPVKADTICLHGDGAHAVAFAQHLHAGLLFHHICIQHP